jgi:Uma2 family endonuclease
MAQAGILTENDRVELLRGEIVEKMTIGPAHMNGVNRLAQFFYHRFGAVAVISIQNPIRTADSEPEPDLAVLSLHHGFDSKVLPTGKDVLLVIEVADTTLETDRTLKCEIYAEAGIPEYWIVNLVEECLEVHRQPLSSGSYASVERLDRSASLTPVKFPDSMLKVSELL